jgi:hypothetical protein
MNMTFRVTFALLLFTLCACAPAAPRPAKSSPPPAVAKPERSYRVVDATAK